MERFVKPRLSSYISYYRATVVTPASNGRMTVKRPFDNPVSLPYVAAVEDLAAGDQCTVFVFGDSSNAIVVGNGSLSVFGSGGGGGGSQDVVADTATIDRFRSSRRIPLYLAANTQDDNYVTIVEDAYQLIAGVYDATLSGSYLDANGNTVSTTGTTQAQNQYGVPLFWATNPSASGVSIGADGYPYLDGVRIPTVTENTGFPVIVYTYNEKIKATFTLQVNAQTGDYEPHWVFGEGDQNGYNKGTLAKMSDGMSLLLSAQDGDSVGLNAGYDGYLDLYGLRRPTAIDFSAWNSGLVTETLDGNVTNSFAVEFDANGQPIKFTTSDGHETVVSW